MIEWSLLLIDGELPAPLKSFTLHNAPWWVMRFPPNFSIQPNFSSINSLSLINTSFLFFNKAKAKQLEWKLMESIGMEWCCGRGALAPITRNKDKLTYLFISFHSSTNFSCWMEERKGRAVDEEKRRKTINPFNLMNFIKLIL